MHFLTFSAHFNRDKGLDMGRLRLCHLTKGAKPEDVWRATSSTENRQDPENFHQRGGMIPPEYRARIPMWTVSTKPIAMLNNPGVAGNFYKIDPHSVSTDKGGVRGDFGIHLDGNAPGSLGCIVMTADRFALFEAEMKKLLAQGITSLPLFVTYS